MKKRLTPVKAMLMGISLLALPVLAVAGRFLANQSNIAPEDASASLSNDYHYSGRVTCLLPDGNTLPVRDVEIRTINGNGKLRKDTVTGSDGEFSFTIEDSDIALTSSSDSVMVQSTEKGIVLGSNDELCRLNENCTIGTTRCFGPGRPELICVEVVCEYETITRYIENGEICQPPISPSPTCENHNCLVDSTECRSAGEYKCVRNCYATTVWQFQNATCSPNNPTNPPGNPINPPGNPTNPPNNPTNPPTRPSIGNIAIRLRGQADSWVYSQPIPSTKSAVPGAGYVGSCSPDSTSSFEQCSGVTQRAVQYTGFNFQLPNCDFIANPTGNFSGALTSDGSSLEFDVTDVEPAQGEFNKSTVFISVGNSEYNSNINIYNSLTQKLGSPTWGTCGQGWCGWELSNSIVKNSNNSVNILVTQDTTIGRNNVKFSELQRYIEEDMNQADYKFPVEANLVVNRRQNDSIGGVRISFLEVAFDPTATPPAVILTAITPTSTPVVIPTAITPTSTPVFIPTAITPTSTPPRVIQTTVVTTKTPQVPTTTPVIVGKQVECGGKDINKDGVINILDFTQLAKDIELNYYKECSDFDGKGYPDYGKYGPMDSATGITNFDKPNGIFDLGDLINFFKEYQGRGVEY